MKHFIIIVAALFLPKGLQAYKAAVVEYYSTASDTPEDTILKNLESYRKYVAHAQDQDVDIIVFPEYGLTTITHDPEEYAIDLSITNQKVIAELKAIASEHGIYLVINLLEKFQEANRKTKYFNTNLVFDRQGKIIAKYRKINLFDERKLTPGTDLVTFTTDFGVTFGVFTCFDLMFLNPSRTILDLNVTDVVFPTAWISITPFFSSLSVQHGYSVANGVNLLAANYGKPKEARGGSGIYLASGKISEIYIDGTPSSKLIVREVREIASRHEPTTCISFTPQGLPLPDGDAPSINEYKTIKSFKASNYKFESVDLSQKQVSSTVCHGKFCCNFNITISQPSNPKEIYKLVAYDGSVSYDRAQIKANLRICSLVACTSQSLDSCGGRINGTTKFTRLRVDGMFEQNDQTLYRPITLNYNLQPIEEAIYCNSHDSRRSYVQLSTYQSQDAVVAFGIFGRDNNDSGVNSAQRAMFSLYVMIFLIFMNLI